LPTLVAQPTTGATLQWFVDGVAAGTDASFVPDLSEAGEYQIGLSQTTTCESSRSYQTIVINESPEVLIYASSTIESNASPITVNAQPNGGVLTGTGVSGLEFNPAVAGIGEHVLTYTFTDPTTGCSGTNTHTIVVEQSISTDTLVDEINFATDIYDEIIENNWIDDKYPQSAVTEFNTAITTAQTVLTNAASYTQTQIDEAANALHTAYQTLLTTEIVKPTPVYVKATLLEGNVVMEIKVSEDLAVIPSGIATSSGL